MNICEVCNGKLENRCVLAGFRFLGETIYIENVPAWVCTHCSEQYYDALIYKQMEQNARHKERIERMISFPLAEYKMAGA